MGSVPILDLPSVLDSDRLTGEFPRLIGCSESRVDPCQVLPFVPQNAVGECRPGAAAEANNDGEGANSCSVLWVLVP